MPIYVPKIEPIEVHQWFRLGDHPNDLTVNGLNQPKIVRPYISDRAYVCNICKRASVEHGRLATESAVKVVCPGDWIITLRDPKTRLPLGYELITDKELKTNYELTKDE